MSNISKKLRIVLNDHSGHDFSVQLSRELARRGHTILHIYSIDFPGPKGDLVPKPDDPKLFSVKGLTLGEPFQKYNFLKRRGQEIQHSRLVIDEVDAFVADIVVGTNIPLDALRILQKHCRTGNIPLVLWLQDIYSSAIKNILSGKIPIIGRLVGAFYEHIERRLLNQSAHIVAITDDFLPQLSAWGIPASRISVIENWGNKETIKVGPRHSRWREVHGLGDYKVILYTGTLGLKHNPDLILAAARTFAAEREDVKIVVTSDGPQLDYLRTIAANEGLPNVLTLPFQAYEQYGDMLASADVLIAALNPEAASYSVPSKVLSYLCSGRAIVLSANKNNLASRIISGSHSGIVTSPNEIRGFVAAIETLLDDHTRREACGGHARNYADEHFDVHAIADQFETLLLNCF
jgi:colanic acid biosynthesis glycosyl transferase WcaI